MKVTKATCKLRKRSKHSHKGENGHLLVVAGSLNYVGAAVLSSIAAFRTGVDLVTVAAPEKVALTINAINPDIITIKFKGNNFKSTDATKIKKLAEGKSAMLIGCGFGKSKSTAAFSKAITKIKLPKVIDADAIRAIKLQDIDNAILTPHHNEFFTLLKNSSLTKNTFQHKMGSNVVLLKGAHDHITSKTKSVENATGNAGMTKGGTGDVLAGIAAGLVAQGNSLFTAACAAAFINGNIGDKLQKKLPNGFLASEMLNHIPKEVAKLE